MKLQDIWRRSRFGKAFLSLSAALALAIGAGFLTSAQHSHAASAASAAIPDLPPADRDSGAAQLPASGTFSPLVKQTSPAVVSIWAERNVKAPDIPRGLQPFFGPGPQRDERQEGLGSGVIVSPDGYILTNHHVIEDADEIKVFLSDDREFKAEILGSDEKTDIALLKVEANLLPTIKLGNSDSVEVGDIVLAIGNPFGVGQTVTMGIVGATGREFGIMRRQSGYEDFIQTDAAINPGNSGGALINTRGELVGVNTAIVSRSGGNQGIGFAVPVNLAHHVMKQLTEHGRVVRGYMGVGIGDVTPAMAKALDLPDSKGAVVQSVEPGGPADKAGFKRYDVIREVAGKPVKDARELRLEVANRAPDEAIDVAVLRDGSEQDLKITLGELPGAEPQDRGEDSGQASALEGVSVEPLTQQIAGRLGLDADVNGVVVTRVRRGTPAAQAGLEPGLVIEEVNRHPVASVDEFQNAIRDAGKDPVLLLVTSRRGSTFVVVEP